MQHIGEECSPYSGSPKLFQLTETQTHEASSGPQENRDGLKTVHRSCILILENEILPRICLKLYV